jgi:hypothetical protein
MLVTDHGNWLVALGLIVVSGFGDADSGRLLREGAQQKRLCADAHAPPFRPSGTGSRLKPNHEPAQTSSPDQTRPFASVQPHASFTLIDIRHDNQVVALGPVPST